MSYGLCARKATLSQKGTAFSKWELHVGTLASPAGHRCLTTENWKWSTFAEVNTKEFKAELSCCAVHSLWYTSTQGSICRNIKVSTTNQNKQLPVSWFMVSSPRAEETETNLANTFSTCLKVKATLPAAQTSQVLRSQVTAGTTPLFFIFIGTSFSRLYAL